MLSVPLAPQIVDFTSLARVIKCFPSLLLLPLCRILAVPSILYTPIAHFVHSQVRLLPLQFRSVDGHDELCLYYR